MSNGYKVYHINDFIRKTPKGELDIDKSMEIVMELAATAGYHDDHNLLVDLRQAEPLNNFVDILTVAAEFAKYEGVFKNKIAIVIPNTPDRLERAKFFMEALAEATFEIKYFTVYEEAIDWFSTIKKYPEENI
jgi:hypothetical protein